MRAFAGRAATAGSQLEWHGRLLAGGSVAGRLPRQSSGILQATANRNSEGSLLLVQAGHGGLIPVNGYGPVRLRSIVGAGHGGAEGGRGMEGGLEWSGAFESED